MCVQNQLYTNRIIRMMLVGGYFDESTDEFSERVYTVAGYIAPGLQASIFEMRWNGLLKKWKFDTFKASQLEYGFGDFVQYRDDPENKQARLSEREKSLIREIKTEFVDLICKEPDLWGYSVTLNIRDYTLLQLQEPHLAKLIPTPYLLCAQMVMVEAGYELEVSNAASPNWAKALIRPIFDSHKVHASRMKEAFLSFKRGNPEASRHMLPPLYEDDQTYPCLQAADCLAFESRKFVDAATGDNKPDVPRKAFLRLMEHVRTAYYLDYEAMKLIASCQPQPDRQLIDPIIDNRRGNALG